MNHMVISGTESWLRNSFQRTFVVDAFISIRVIPKKTNGILYFDAVVIIW